MSTSRHGDIAWASLLRRLKLVTDSGQPSAGSSLAALPEQSTVSLRIPRSAFWNLSMLAVATWSIAIFVCVSRPNPILSNSNAEAFGNLSITKASATVPKKGRPWGRLSYERMILSPPIEFVKIFDVNSIVTDWFFPQSESDELRQLLAEFGVSDELQQRLLSVSQWDASVQRQRLQVTNEMIADIPIETRGRIYKYLEEDGNNFAQATAFRFCGDSVDEWFRNAGLRPAIVNQVKSMVYQNGSYLMFADLRLVLPELRSEEEKFHLLTILGRHSTLLASLNLDHGADLDKLVRYWGRRGRAKDVRPILEALVVNHRDNRIDISHLLTPFARKRLYTYLNPFIEDMTVKRDCHWTAYNFYNLESDDHLEADPAELRRLIKEEYYQVYGDLQFGDVVSYVDQNGDVFHSAVYIADDLVFTKNGQGFLQPWHFRRLAEMKDLYCRRTPVRVLYLRNKQS